MLTFEPQWLDLQWPDVLGRLKDLNYRASIVGDHGSGKTTLFAELQRRLERQGFVVLPLLLNEQNKALNKNMWQQVEQLSQRDKEVIVMLDGAECLSWFQWRSFHAAVGNCRGLLITQHKSGRLPTLLRTETRLEMLVDFVNRLAPEEKFKKEQLERIFVQCKGNIREALWSCYDLLALGKQSER